MQSVDDRNQMEAVAPRESLKDLLTGFKGGRPGLSVTGNAACNRPHPTPLQSLKNGAAPGRLRFGRMEEDLAPCREFTPRKTKWSTCTELESYSY